MIASCRPEAGFTREDRVLAIDMAGEFVKVTVPHPAALLHRLPAAAEDRRGLAHRQQEFIPSRLLKACALRRRGRGLRPLFLGVPARLFASQVFCPQDAGRRPPPFCRS